MATQDSILVTGASRGIGMETALRLAQSGFRVWAGVRNPDRVQPLLDEARKRGVSVEPLGLDMTDPVSIDAAVKTILENSSGLYGLVNNAGVTRIGYFEEFTDDEVRRILETNLIGVMNLTRRVLAPMREARRGRIVMMSSIGGRIGSLCLAPYFASKFAIEGFAESLYVEMAPFGVKVVVIEPGMVKTAIWDDEVYLPASQDPGSPYYRFFTNMRAASDALLKSANLTPVDVAEAIERVLRIEHPRLRYILGWRARMLMTARRYMPGETFEKLYYGEVLRRVTK